MPVVTLHRPLYALCRLALPLAALGLAACASEAPRPLPTRLNDVPLSTAMAVPGAAPQVWNESFGPGVGELGLRFASNAPLESAAPLLSTGLNFAGLARRLQYSAGYQFSPGDLLNPDAAQQWRSDALPQSVGTQTLHQQLRLQIDTLAGAPLTVGARSTQQDALLFEGSSESQQQAMDLSWAPSFASMRLNWTPEGAPVDARQALQCDRSGQLSVPLAGLLGSDAGDRHLAVDARARQCRVSGDDATLARLTANTWSTGLRWGGARRETALRLQSVTPGVDANVVASDRPLTAGSAYELRVSQSRALGDWQARAGVAYRRPPQALRVLAAPPEASPWATSAELSRRVHDLTVAASWQRGDLYWFLPDISEPADTFALALNFAPWAGVVPGAYTPTMAMSYSWVRADGAGDDEQTVNWNLSFPWR